MSALLLCWRSYCWAHNLWGLINYLFFLQVMLPSVVPRLATDSAVSVSWCLESSLFLRLSSQDGALSLPLLSLFFPFMFCPTSFQREWVAFLGVSCSLPAFRSCFVEVVQHSKDLLRNLWGRKWSSHPIPLPSSVVRYSD